MAKRILAGLIIAFACWLSIAHAEGERVLSPETAAVYANLAVQEISSQIYQNESFVRVRGSANVTSQVSGSSMVVRYQDKKFILTNFHVVQAMVEVYVEDLKTGNMYPSNVIGKDSVLDLAILSLPRELEHLKEVPFSDAVVGEIVFAIGFPFGQRNVTVGFITSDKLVYAMFLLSQVPLNPGNSGGPLLNARQEVVGINTAYRPQANLYSFSIPSSYVQRMLPQLVAGGTIRHGHPKLNLADYRDLLPRNFSAMGIPYPLKKPGVVVLGFQDDGASQQGIDIGDVIVAIDGFRIESLGDYADRLLFFYKSGQKVTFTLLRGGEEIQVELKLSSVAEMQ